MKTSSRLSLFFIPVLLGGFVYAADNTPTPPTPTTMPTPTTVPQVNPLSPVVVGATPQQIADTFAFTEGPASDADGNLFFTDQPNDTIYKYSIDNKLTVFMKPCGRANGLCFDGPNLIACADQDNQLWSIDPKGKATPLIKSYNDKLLNGPNDIWINPFPGSGMYFTDPMYKRDYWKRGPTEQPGEYVYYFSSDHKLLTPVITDLKKPNGIIGTPDGKTLYVADIGANKTYSYAIQPDGSLTNKQLFCSMGSDGMTIDSAGNLYLCGKGVTIFSPAGKRLDRIAINEDWTANVAFGGKDHSTLFITASKSLYALQMTTRGVGSQ